jgi:hypothetical protein
MRDSVRPRAGLGMAENRNTPVSARDETCAWTDTNSPLNSFYALCAKNALKYKT